MASGNITLSASPTVCDRRKKTYVFMFIEDDFVTRVFRGDPYSPTLMSVGEFKLPSHTFGLGYAACGDKLFAFGGVTCLGEGLYAFPRDVYICDVSKLDNLGPGSGKWVKSETKLKGPKPQPLVAVLDDRIYALQGDISSFIPPRAFKFCDSDDDKVLEEEEEEEEEEEKKVLEEIDPVFEILDTNFLDGGWTKLATPPFRYGRAVRAFTVVDNTIYMHFENSNNGEDFIAFDVIQGRWKDTISTNLTKCFWTCEADVVDNILFIFSCWGWTKVYGYDLLTCNEEKEELAKTPIDMDPMNEGKDEDVDATMFDPSDFIAENEEKDTDDASSSDVSVGVMTEEEVLMLPSSSTTNSTNIETECDSDDEAPDIGHCPGFPIHGLEQITKVAGYLGITFGCVTPVEDDLYCLTIFYMEKGESRICHKARFCKFRLLVERNGSKVKELRADDIEYEDCELENVLGYFLKWCTSMTT